MAENVEVTTSKALANAPKQSVASFADYTPSGLLHLDLRHLAFPIDLGEKIAFREDHEMYPGLYGQIQAIGYDPDSGAVVADVLVLDPFTGEPVDDSGTVHRLDLLEEIQ